MSAYYNEIDPYAAQWLRNLIDKGLIAPGVVDERSIEDVKPDELMGYTQCHFFAGIGVWSLALRRAGWPDNRPIWTGSCPCQSFSSAGSQSGFEDARHLWPSLAWLIKQCGPSVVVGEQVASKSVEPWIDLVQTDLEALDYAFGCVPFPSAGVGAPHIRDRNYWMGYSSIQGLQAREPAAVERTRGREERGAVEQPGRTPGGLADNNRPGPANGFWSAADWLGCRDGKWRPVEPGTFPLADRVAARVGRLRAYGNAINAEAATIFIQSVMELLNSSSTLKQISNSHQVWRGAG
jgi:DNA (cytosine-5)-methyltransferase 1